MTNVTIILQHRYKTDLLHYRIIWFFLYNDCYIGEVMIMKKLFILLSIVLIITGCGTKEEKKNETPKKETTQAVNKDKKTPENKETSASSTDGSQKENETTPEQPTTTQPTTQAATPTEEKKEEAPPAYDILANLDKTHNDIYKELDDLGSQMKFKKYQTISELYNKEFSPYMTEDVFRNYFTFAYEEKPDGLYVNPTDALIMFYLEVPYDLKKINDETYELLQVMPSGLHSPATLKIIFSKQGNKWIITHMSTFRTGS